MTVKKFTEVLKGHGGFVTNETRFGTKDLKRVQSENEKQAFNNQGKGRRVDPGRFEFYFNIYRL
jgi:hypothetical protein